MRVQLLFPAAFAAGAALILMAAQRPASLAQVSPGLWEIVGAPGARSPVRECVSDFAALARFEHRARSCKGSLISRNGSSSVLAYDCGGANFGRSEINVLTPRSLRIETQGISDNMPFNYVLQARRVGDCSPKAAVAAH